MKKKIIIFSLFSLMTLLVPSFASAYGTFSEQPQMMKTAVEQQRNIGTEKKSEARLGTAYLAISVIAYTPGLGIYPCPGANIHIKGLFYSYNETTDENGFLIFEVHAPLFRQKLYFITINLTTPDRVLKRLDFVSLRAQQIYSREYIFFIFNES
jgi:hypothetical protein